MTMYIDNIQFEVKSHPTRFVAGGRSVVDGWRNLVGTSHGLLDTAAFDSNSDLDFDKTHNISFGTSYAGTYTNGLSIVAVIHPTYITGWNAVAQYATAGDSALYINGSSFGLYSTGWDTGSGIVINTTQHIVCTVDGSNAGACYYNGTKVATVSVPAGVRTWEYFHAGGINVGDGENFVGKIYLLQVYNRRLTDAEVTKIYASQKKRFGLA